jgi:hypothetical protein
MTASDGHRWPILPPPGEREKPTSGKAWSGPWQTNFEAVDPQEDRIKLELLLMGQVFHSRADVVRAHRWTRR